MKKILLAVLMALSASAVAGNCTYPDDIAADGSICGGRAASVRPGGEVPPPEYAPHSSTYETDADCSNGYSVKSVSIVNPALAEAVSTKVFKSGELNAVGSTEDTALVPDGDSVENLTTKTLAGDYVILAYTYNFKNLDGFNKGSIIKNAKVIASCKVSMHEVK